MNIEELTEHLTKHDDCDQYDQQKLKSLLQKGSSHNRIYTNQGQKSYGFMSTTFTLPIYYAGQPYFCPNGWRRYSLSVGLTKEQFNEKYKNWPVAYHGTSSQAAFAIITRGFKSAQGCWIKKQEKAAYFTPSIIYASHPRYAKIQKIKNMYIQLVLQVRIKKQKFFKRPGTLQNAYPQCQKRVDPNYDNNYLEWLYLWNENKLIKQKDGVVVYGIMLKISAQDPYKIQENDWYKIPRT